MKITIEKITAVLTTKKHKKTFNEKLGAFSVIIDSLAATNYILDRARSLGLSVPRIGEINPTKKQSTLTFFFDHPKDVDYVHTAEESIVRNLVPRFSAKNDKWTIIGMLREKSAEKKALRKLFGGIGVRGRTLRELTVLKKELTKRRKPALVDILAVPVKARQCSCKPTYVEVSEHYVQIGTKFYKKNPNDRIWFKGQLLS